MILHCADCNILNETNYDSFESEYDNDHHFS